MKIRLIWDDCTPTAERRPTTAKDIEEDIHIEEYSSEDDLYETLLGLAGYYDAADFEDEADCANCPFDMKLELLLGMLEDPGDGTPNILYLSFDGKEADYDSIGGYDGLDELDLETCTEDELKEVLTDYLIDDYDDLMDVFDDDEEPEGPFQIQYTNTDDWDEVSDGGKFNKFDDAVDAAKELYHTNEDCSHFVIYDRYGDIIYNEDDLEESLKEGVRYWPRRYKGYTYWVNNDDDTDVILYDEDGAIINTANSEKQMTDYIDNLNTKNESLNEDTIKQNGKWVNKGKGGIHGKFKTKKAADAQRKAMFANGYKESLTESEDIEKDLDFLAKDEQEAIDGYDKIINKTKEKNLKKQLKHIRDEEDAHLTYLNNAKTNPNLKYEHEDLKENIDFDDAEDAVHDLYRAIGDVITKKYQSKGLTRKELASMLDQVQLHLEDDEDYDWLDLNEETIIESTDKSLHEAVEEIKPYNYRQIYVELRDCTNNFTEDYIEFHYSYESEANTAVDILKSKYTSVEMEVVHNSIYTGKDVYIVTASDPLKSRSDKKGLE